MTASEDLFTPIHKALRSMLYSLSGRLQTNDFGDLTATKSLVTDLQNDFDVARSAGCTLCVMSRHAVDEESAIFPSVSTHGNALVTALIAEHHDLTRRELGIQQAAHEILAMESPEDRVRAGVELNQRSNELTAAYLAHMNREETELVPLMQEHFTDEQMIGMRAKIMGALPPERLFGVLGWMLPSLNVTELVSLMTSLRASAPPPFQTAVSDLAAAKVEPARWHAVKLRVGL